MSMTPHQKRILIALDSSPHGQSALHLACRLAARSRAELCGLFVEDVNLLRLANLPFASEIDLVSGAVRQVETSQMERYLRVAASQIERQLDDLAKQHGVPWSFLVSRGRVIPTLLDEMRELDLLLIGREGRFARSLATTVTRNASALTLPVVAVIEASRPPLPTLQVAAELAHDLGAPVHIVIGASPGQPVAEWVEECEGYLRSVGVRSSMRRFRFDEADRFIETMRTERPSILVLHRNIPWLNEKLIDSLINELDCPVALVS